jgi:Outer membrane protein beta-barrel domain
MMSSKLKFIMALCGAALTPLPALCQETTAYKSEVNVEGFLPIVKSTTANGVQQSTSLNGGVLAGYRFFFGTHNGVEVSYGYSRSTETYNVNNSPAGLDANSNEIFAAYVYRFPHKRWSPFLLAGAGGRSLTREAQPARACKCAPGICTEAALTSRFTDGCWPVRSTAVLSMIPQRST